MRRKIFGHLTEKVNCSLPYVIADAGRKPFHFGELHMRSFAKTVEKLLEVVNCFDETTL